MEACELVATELRLDRIEAELATELPPHLRTFARAHATGSPSPPAPDVLRRATTLAAARAALAHPVLADRGLALLRLAAPIAIESDPAVTAARAATPTWEALAALAAARDAAARAWFGRRAIEVIHRLHGSAAAGDARAALPGVAGGSSTLDDAAAGAGHDRGLPPAVPGWFEPDGIAVDDRAIAQAWDDLRARHGGAGGTVRFERNAAARPRAIVVDPGREVIIAIPARIAAPAGRFAVLHELGHALAALGLPAGIPRALDEAVAACVARAVEREPCPWYSPAARAARARRLALARVLDRIERALPELPEASDRPADRPPWALWNDPGAQAAYVIAEALADALDQITGQLIDAAPAPGALAAAATALREPIDRLGSGAYAI